jgi:hypothetical protein
MWQPSLSGEFQGMFSNNATCVRVAAACTASDGCPYSSVKRACMILFFLSFFVSPVLLHGWVLLLLCCCGGVFA